MADGKEQVSPEMNTAPASVAVDTAPPANGVTVPVPDQANADDDQPAPRPHTPAQQPAKTPRQSAEGIEKTDWEVVNASPSHSPSKDADNQNITTQAKGKSKTTGRERESSSSSGKFGQKIDGVKKVLKSGVFGGSSPKSAPAATTGRAAKTITKPPVPSARSVTKTATSTSVTGTTAASRARAGSVSAVKPGVPPVKPTTTTSAKPNAPKPTAAPAATTTRPPSRPDSPIVPRPDGAPPPVKSGRAATAALRASSNIRSTDKGTSATLARRGSAVSPPTTVRGEATATSVNPRAPLPIAAKMAKSSSSTSTGAESSARAGFTRPSTAPSAVVKKEVDDLKAKVTGLEAQLASESAAHKTELGKLRNDRDDLENRHSIALLELASDYEAAVQEVKQTACRHADCDDSGFEDENCVIPQLKSKLESHDRMVEVLNAQLAGLQEFAAERRAHVLQINQDRTRLGEELDEAHAATQKAEAELVVARNLLSTKEQDIAAGVESLHQERLVTTKLDEHVARFQLRVEQLEEELESSKEADQAQADLQKQIETLLAEAQVSARELREKCAELAESRMLWSNVAQANETHLAAITVAKEAAEKQDALIAELREQVEEGQRKHDGLLLEAANMSDARIAELSDEVDKVNSLRNELAAELEEEQTRSDTLRKNANAAREELEAAKPRMQQVETELERLREEMIEAQAEHDRKYASAFEDATKVATAEHAKDVELLQQELEATNKQLAKEHEAKLQRLESKHAIDISELREEHQRKVSELMERVQTTETLLAGAQTATATVATDLDIAEDKARRVREELEAALAKRDEDDSVVKGELAAALRKNAELTEELETVRSMAEVNRSQFESLRQSTEDAHATALRDSSAQANKDLEDARVTHQRMVQGLRDEVRHHRDELERARAAYRDLGTHTESLHRELIDVTSRLADAEARPSAFEQQTNNSLLLDHDAAEADRGILGRGTASSGAADDAPTLTSQRTLSERLLGPESADHPSPLGHDLSSDDNDNDEDLVPDATVRPETSRMTSRDHAIPSSTGSIDQAGSPHAERETVESDPEGDTAKVKQRDEGPDRWAPTVPPAGFNGTTASLPPNPFYSDSSASENESNKSLSPTSAPSTEGGSDSGSNSGGSQSDQFPYKRHESGEAAEEEEDSSEFDISREIEIDPSAEITPNASTFKVDLPDVGSSSQATARPVPPHKTDVVTSSPK